MSMDIDDIVSLGDISLCLNWALETGIWDGRPVSLEKTSDFQNEVQQRILEIFFQNSPSPAFDLKDRLAWIDTDRADEDHFSKDLDSFSHFIDNDYPRGLKRDLKKLSKKCGKVWKKHKKEILIGGAIVIAIAGFVALAVTSAAAAAGAAAAGSSKKKEDEPDAKEPPKSDPPASPPPPTQGSLNLAPIKPLESYLNTAKPVFETQGLTINGEFSNYLSILQNLTASGSPLKSDSQPPFLLAPQLSTQFEPSASISGIVQPAGATTPPPSQAPISSSEKSWFVNFLETIGHGIIEPDLLNPNDTVSPAPKATASRFTTSGIQDPHLKIGSINGINTSMDAAASHANYLAGLASGRSIEGIYNCSHGAAIDLLEVFTLNYSGQSPKTGHDLQDSWNEFHKQNADRPNAKYLQFCHSQGAIHVRNALANAPKEIQDRVIVVAIAPAAIVPKEICFRSYNYASKKDIVPLGELFFAGAFDTKEVGSSTRVDMVMELRKQLIILDPHPDAVGIDHDFQSPTFKDVIADTINYFIQHNGVYE